MKWRRREAGSYVTTIRGERYTIVNMKGDGPNSPRYAGALEPGWQIRRGGTGDYDIGCTVIGHEFTLTEAKRKIG